MLNINLSKFIHPNFKKPILPLIEWEIYPPLYVSQALVLETLRIPTDIIQENRIFEIFIQKIDETSFIENERELLFTLRLPLFILSITTPMAPVEVRYFFKSKMDPLSLQRIGKFIEFYQMEMKDALDDPKSRKGILEDLQNFWGRFSYEVKRCAQIGPDIFIDSLGMIPPHLPQHYIEKLALLALYPDYPLLIVTLREIFPRLRVLIGFESRIVRTTVFWEILKFITKNTRSDFITYFNQQVWELHLYSKEDNLPVVQCSGKLTEKDLLGQVLCFMLPNWAQVWCELGWPFTNEIKRRLKILKQQKWTPPIKEFIKVILNS